MGKCSFWIENDGEGVENKGAGHSDYERGMKEIHVSVFLSL